MAIPYQRIRRVLQQPRAVQVPMWRRRAPLSELPTSYQLEEGFSGVVLENTIAQVLDRFGYAGVTTAISTAFDLGWYAILNCAELTPVIFGAQGERLPPEGLLQEEHHTFLLDHAEQLLNLSNFPEELGIRSERRWQALLDRSQEAFRIETRLHTGDVEYPCSTLALILHRTYQALAMWFHEYRAPEVIVEITAEYLQLMLHSFGRLVLYAHSDPLPLDQIVLNEPVVIRWVQRWYNEWLTRLAFVGDSE